MVERDVGGCVIEDSNIQAGHKSLRIRKKVVPGGVTAERLQTGTGKRRSGG